MDETLALIDLAGNIALLLWGLHMVQTGIIRAYGADIRLYLRIALHSRLKAFFAGFGATIVLQSSTAVGMMATSFTAFGFIELAPALALMLGANVGTTLIVELLSFNISRVAPIFVLLGVVAFRRSRRAPVRDLGRVSIGLGLMLFALEQMVRLLNEAGDSETMHLLLQVVMQDHFLDMLLGALITWAMHSSVAAVLLTMSLSAQHLISPDVAFALVIGANLGSAINPVLERATGGNPASRRLPIGNLINRAVGCLIFLPLVSYADALPPALMENPAHSVAHFHFFFNLVMAILFFPVLPFFVRLLARLLPEHTSGIDPAAPKYLDQKLLTTPDLAIANAARETMRMADILQEMLGSIREVFAGNDRNRIDDIRRTDDVLDQLNRQVKLYLTALPHEKLAPEDEAHLGDVLSFSMSMEHIGDIISNGLAKLIAKKIKRRLIFSEEGHAEIHKMLGNVAQNIQLATAAFMTRDVRLAQQLNEENNSLSGLEAEATQAHFARLREGRQESIETSALHLDIVRDLKLIHAQLAAIAGRILAAK